MTIKLNIKGMSCGGCVNAVRQALAGVDGVDIVTVDLESAKATVTSESGNITPTDLIIAVKSAGYDASLM